MESEDTQQEINYSIPLLKLNQYQVQMNRILIAVISGVVAGIFRIEGILNGLVFLFFSNVLGSTIMCLSMRTEGVSSYFPGGVKDVYLSQNMAGLMTYILVWTLAYDIIHIF